MTTPVNSNHCLFIANNNIADDGLSGGDRIFIELARDWSQRMRLELVGCEEAITICRRYGLDSLKAHETTKKLGIADDARLSVMMLNLVKKLAAGLRFQWQHRELLEDNPTIYSVSDFYPDFAPALLAKWLNPKCHWIAGFYLFAPPPFSSASPYKGKNRLKGLLYWLSQRPAYWLVNKFADRVFVTSEPDIVHFVGPHREARFVEVIRGGVSTEPVEEYQALKKELPAMEQRKYDACFLGRFHHQKGVLILADIWAALCRSNPKARLAMIGNGELEAEVKQKFKKLGLLDQVDFFGFLDGERKFEIFRNSKVMVHPATYDSGGMACAEGMAWGLPAVGFDLQALKTYYPKGMLKAPEGDVEAFAAKIHQLLEEPELYQKLSDDAHTLVREAWDWRAQAANFHHRVFDATAQ